MLNSDLIAVEFNNGQKQILSDYPDSTTQKIDGYTAVEARDLIKGTLSGDQERNYQITSFFFIKYFYLSFFLVRKAFF